MPESSPPESSGTPEKWELELVASCAKGEIAQFPTSETGEPVAIIRASVLRRLILGLPHADATSPHQSLTGVGVQLRGARILGVLNLDRARSTGGAPLPPIDLRECILEEGLSGDNAYFSTLTITDCSIGSPPRLANGELKPELSLSGAQVQGILNVCGVRPTGPDGTLWLVLFGARIQGDFRASRSLFKVLPPEDPHSEERVRYALDLAACEIAGHVELQPNVTIDGGVSLANSRVNGSIYLSGAKIRKGLHEAISGQQLWVGGNWLMASREVAGVFHRTEVTGRIWLFGATIHGGFVCSGAWFDNAKAASLVLVSASIGGSLWLETVTFGEDIHPFIATGRIGLVNASIANDVRLTGAQLRFRGVTSLDAQDVVIRGDVLLTSLGESRFRAESSISFNAATIDGELNMSGALIRGALFLGQVRIGGNAAFGIEGKWRCRIVAAALLSQAHIEGDLDFGAASLGEIKGLSLDLVDATIGGNGYFNAKGGGRFRAAGLLRMPDANFKRDVSFSGALLRAGLDANDVRIDGNAFFRVASSGVSSYAYPFESAGTVDFQDAQIGGRFLFEASRLAGQAMALGAKNITVEGDVLLARHGPLSFNSAGSVIFDGARLKRNLGIHSAYLGSLFMKQAIVGHDVDISNVIVGHLFDASGITVGGDFSLEPAGSATNLESMRLQIKNTLDLRSADISGRARMNVEVEEVRCEHIYVRDDLRLAGLIGRQASFLRGRIDGECDLSSLAFKPQDDPSAQSLLLKDAHIGQALRVATEEYDPGPLVLRAALAVPLRCYPEYTLVNMDVAPETAQVRMWLAVLSGPNAEKHLLDGRPTAFELLNSSGRLDLSSDAHVLEYLRLFCSHVWNLPAGPFRIVESMDELHSMRHAEREWTVPTLVAVEQKTSDDARWAIVAAVRYGCDVFQCKFHVSRYGIVAMVEERPVGMLPLHTVPRYERTFRIEKPGAPVQRDFEGSWTEVTERAQLEDLRKAIGTLSTRRATFRDATIDLRGGRCRRLEDDDGRAWGTESQLNLENFAYDSYARKRETRAPYSDGVKSTLQSIRERLWFLRRERRVSDERLRWLASQYTGPARSPWQFPGSRERHFREYRKAYTPQPYAHLAKVCRAMGDVSSAREIEVKKLGIEWGLASRRLVPPFSWLLSGCQFWYWFGFRYGYSSPRAILFAIAMIVVGACGASTLNRNGLLVVDVTPISAVQLLEAGPSASASRRINAAGSSATIAELPCGTEIEPSLYAADVFIPLLDLRQESQCRIRDASTQDDARWYAQTYVARGDAGGLLKRGHVAAAVERATSAWVKATIEHPTFWHWVKSVYAFVGWVVTSLTILTISGTLRWRSESQG